jgi:hypothetical protein
MKSCIGSRMVAAVIAREEPINEGGMLGHRTVPDHKAEGLAEVWVDVGVILNSLSTKALRSKGQKAQALRGAVVVKIKNARKLPL